ncbi:MAG: DUF4331 family protein, partial [Myxococcota bacterium]
AIACWVGDPNDGGAYVEGDPSAEAGLSNDAGNVTVFAGSRNDPFFFNAGGFLAAVAAVEEAAAGGLTLDGNGCPELAPATAEALRGLLSDNPVDAFAGNISALVIQVDKNLVNGGGDTLAVWASTHTN